LVESEINMARPDNPNREQMPKVFEMPQPRFLSVINSSGKYEKHIGIEAYGTDHNFKRFLLVQNIKIGDLNEIENRSMAASFRALLTLHTGVDIAIGLPVLPKSSQPFNAGSEPVRVSRDPLWHGVYANTHEINQLKNLMASIGSISLEALMKRYPSEYLRLYKDAMETLPTPARIK
jgi:hypothetical protein